MSSTGVGEGRDCAAWANQPHGTVDRPDLEKISGCDRARAGWRATLGIDHGMFVRHHSLTIDPVPKTLPDLWCRQIAFRLYCASAKPVYSRRERGRLAETAPLLPTACSGLISKELTDGEKIFG
jgi:hypothetical protein